ncbi:hypothetical protein HRbin36_02698 [bacterium HR36]|nr:hypothetical protein HRbin36_02698 [bacterium HR36]
MQQLFTAEAVLLQFTADEEQVHQRLAERRVKPVRLDADLRAIGLHPKVYGIGRTLQENFAVSVQPRQVSATVCGAPCPVAEPETKIMRIEGMVPGELLPGAAVVNAAGELLGRYTQFFRVDKAVLGVGHLVVSVRQFRQLLDGK